MSEIDLEIADLPQPIKNKIIQEAGEFLVEQVLLSMGEARSPVSGEVFPKLTKDYKAHKLAEGGSSSPDLELTGDLKDALTYRPTANGLELGFFGDQADKADGHLKFSGRTNNTPQRRFLPGEGQSFKGQIEREIDMMIREKAADAVTKQDLRGVQDSKALYDTLGEIFGVKSKYQIRDSVTSSPYLLDLLYSMDLLRFL